MKDYLCKMQKNVLVWIAAEHEEDVQNWLDTHTSEDIVSSSEIFDISYEDSIDMVEEYEEGRAAIILGGKAVEKRVYEDALLDAIVYAHQAPLCSDDYNKRNEFYKIRLLNGYHVIIAYKYYDNNYHFLLEDHFSKTIEEKLLSSFNADDVREFIKFGIIKGLEVKANEQ
ncbi:MAG: hypothetical protein E7273_13125 [Pseudobutyrivibrio ruminis]|nr:hypothetical protein [Pseudobutyrivibrio ruminis]